MPVINTQASIEIAASVASVHSVIVNFRTCTSGRRGCTSSLMRKWTTAARLERSAMGTTGAGRRWEQAA